MRILAISHLFPHIESPNCGIFVARQFAGMAKLGADITIFVPTVWCPKVLRYFNRWKNYDHKRPLCEHEGLYTITAPYLRPPGGWFYRWAGLSAFCSLRRKASEMHQSKPFDVILGRCFFPDGDAAIRLSRVLKIPVVGLGIGSEVNETPDWSKSLYKHFVRTAKAFDATMACGQGVADRIDSVTGKNTLAVYGVVDLDQFTPVTDNSSVRKELGMPLGKLVALYAGNLVKTKGVYEMIEAFARIERRAPKVVLKICGSGQQEDGMRRMIKEKNLDHIIEIVGMVEPKQMHKWMQASDLFVLPSYMEGMPNAVMEAMACGLPVVSTSVGGLPEAVGDCQGAILVPPRNVEEFGKAVFKVLRDDELRVRMGVASRVRAEERFGVTRTCQRMLAYLAATVENWESAH